MSGGRGRRPGTGGGARGKFAGAEPRRAVYHHRVETLLALMPPAALAAACLVTFAGGVVKGTVGFAMPLVMISGMGAFLPPELIVAGIVIPIVTANILQVARSGLGQARAGFRDYRLFTAIVCVAILVSAQILTSIPADTMFLILGVPVVTLCAVQLAGLKIRIRSAWRLPFSVLAGLIAGALGGLAGTWGPPTVLYLLAVDTPKTRQIAVQGVIYGAGSVMLLLGHLQSGVLNRETILFSALLLPPALIGMWMGFRIQDRLDQDKFRRITLIVLIAAGLNLVRRGLAG